MKTRVVLSIVVLVLLLAVSGVGVYAQDYVPSPGVLSPDKVDFGGATVTLVGAISADNFGEGTLKEGRLEEAMKLFNIGGFEFIYRPGAEAIMTRIMTGEATYDIIHDDWREQYFAMAGHGMLTAISDILPKEYYDNMFNADQRIHTDILSIQDSIFTFGHRYGDCFRPTSMVYNESMLAREGLPDIYDLWKAGKWTWEEAEKLVVAVTRDTDGDGVVNQWGIAYRRIDYALYINNAQYIKIDADGRYRYGWADEEAIWIFDKLAEMYRDEYIVPKALDGANRIKSGNVLMQFGSDHPEGGVADNGDILVMAPLPLGPHTDHHIYPEWAVGYAAIPITAENPEGLVAVHDFLFRKEDLDFNTWVRKEVAERFPNQKSAEHLFYAIQNWQGDVEWVNGVSKTPDISVGWGDDIQPLILGVESPRSYLEAKRPVAQAEIDQLFNK